MENDPSKQPADTCVHALMQFVEAKLTGQLTFHFSHGTLRQIQRNVFESVK